MKRKTEIEIEVNETLAYSKRSERFQNYCGSCKRMSEMATPHVASILKHTTEREIYKRWKRELFISSKQIACLCVSVRCRMATRKRSNGSGERVVPSRYKF
jgi:hypothetical protein